MAGLVPAVLVLTPGTPLGLFTNAVQTLAGVLLPSATVFLLLCNDEAVLGPWINGRGLNLFTGGVIVVLVLLSIILIGSVLYPQIGREMIIAILAAGSVSALGIYFVTSSGPPLCRPTGRCAIRGECPRLAGCRRDL